VHKWLRNGASWPEFSPLGSFELEREGDSEREGVGAVRRFRTGRIRTRERIVEIVPDRRLSYVLESGMAIRDYRADVDLTPLADGGTEIRWHSSFRAKFPATGWIYRRALTRFVTELVHGLAARAAEDSAAH